MEGELQRRVGRHLRAYREERGWSQERLAEQLVMHRSYVAGVERGERNLTLQTLEYIAGLIDTDPLELLSPTD